MHKRARRQCLRGVRARAVLWRSAQSFTKRIKEKKSCVADIYLRVTISILLEIVCTCSSRRVLYTGEWNGAKGGGMIVKTERTMVGVLAGYVDSATNDKVDDGTCEW